MSNIDEALYSRQLYVLGKDAMKSITNANILLCGLNGVGLEVAKCIILAGVKSVTLFDNNNLSMNDLSTNYYARETDVGRNRVDVVISQLRELNSYVTIKSNKSTHITEDLIKEHQVIVMCGIMPTDAILYNRMARKHSTKFIIANTFGLMGFVFCDFGSNFTVVDQDGENPKSGVLLEIQSGWFVSNESHQLSTKDKINITSSNEHISGEHIVTKIINRTTFQTNRSPELTSAVLQNASFCQIKESKLLSFDMIDHILLNPTYSTIIRSDFMRHELLHKFIFSLDAFTRHHKRLPIVWNDSDANLLVAIVESFYGKLEKQEKELIKRLSYTCHGCICPVDSIFGSIAGQEVIKAVSNKFIPINQLMYYDSLSILPSDISKILKENNNIKASKYIGLEEIIGKTLVKKIRDSSVFIVGAGAIGCEHLKNFCKMGVGTIHITDMDTIEKSNLNRQFLFRNNDIGKFKSTAAKEAAKRMNSDINITSYQLRVGPETLTVFSEAFFNKLTAVTTALDNVGARIYVDKMCVDTCKPLIDSGTLGSKGNTQVVIPFKSHSYGSTQDPGEQVIPVCTLKHFPYLIEHTIAWARDQFEALFVKPSQDYNKYNSQYTAKTKDEQFDKIPPTDLITFAENIMFIEKNFAKSQEECIKFAYNLWHEYFRDQIYHLTKTYPKNHTGPNKVLFWSGTKNFPTYDNFDIDNDICINFIIAVASLWGEVCGCKVGLKADESLRKYLKKLKVPKITAHKGKIQTEETNGEKTESNEIINDPKEICNQLSTPNKKKQVNILEFEKDNDANYHMEFITATSNLRAINYHIPIADKLKTKGIAGKIIPAIATTTSLVSGLVALELIKIIQGIDILDTYECAFVNLAMSLFSFSEPVPIRKTKLGNYEFSIWNKQIIKNNPTMKDVLKYAGKLINGDENLFDVSMISHGDTILWSDSFPTKIKKSREKLTVKEIYGSAFNIDDITTIQNPILIDVYLSQINDDTSEDEENKQMESISIKVYH